MVTRNQIKNKTLFITGTDTSVGKTVATLVIGKWLQSKGYSVGVFKPVQCAGDDAENLRRELNIKDSMESINPYYANEPLSPNLAFARAKKRINISQIKKRFEELRMKHDVVLVEGAGGLMVPITDSYFVSDLIKDLDVQMLIVSRLGLGTINHTLLTVNQAQNLGIDVKGIIFSQSETEKKGVPEKTNPNIIEKLSKVPVLGVIPYLKSFNDKDILDKCQDIKFNKLFNIQSHNTSKWLDEDKKYLWHPFTQMKDWVKDEPLVIDEANGSYLKDTRGNKYLDGVSSLWVNVHGHRHKHINQSLSKQINKLGHSTLLGLSNTPAVQLAKRLVEISPKGLKKVFYSDNGSTAAEIAIKMAYQYWQNIGQKDKVEILHLENSYHGDTLGSVSVGGIDLFHKVYRKLIFKTTKISFPDCYRAPKDKKYPDYAFEYVNRMESYIKGRHKKIAALIVEPIVQGAAGMIVWPKGVLKAMSQICRKYDVLFIADEVATGFGRTGTMFACQQESVTPDIMCLAKGLTGGYLPLAATLTTNKIYDGFIFDYQDQKTFFHGHTYTGNPICCAAALANLDVFEKERTLDRLAPKIKYLAKKLKMFYNLASVGDVRQKGFMVGIELVSNKMTKKPYPWQAKVGIKVCQRVRNKGVIIRPLGNVIVLMPPLSISIQELDILIEATYQAIEEETQNYDK